MGLNVFIEDNWILLDYVPHMSPGDNASSLERQLVFAGPVAWTEKMTEPDRTTTN